MDDESTTGGRERVKQVVSRSAPAAAVSPSDDGHTGFDLESSAFRPATWTRRQCWSNTDAAAVLAGLPGWELSDVFLIGPKINVRAIRVTLEQSAEAGDEGKHAWATQFKVSP